MRVRRRMCGRRLGDRHIHTTDKLYSMARGLTEAGEPLVKSQIMPSNSSRVAALTGRLIRSVAISDGKVSQNEDCDFGQGELSVVFHFCFNEQSHGRCDHRQVIYKRIRCRQEGSNQQSGGGK